MAKKKTKKTRKKHVLSKFEFLFNFFSLVIVIGIGFYFGYRSLYYYSKQNLKIKEESQTLNGLVIRNNTVVQGDEEGLHQDSLGYFFKGKVHNNYVMFDHKVFRIIRVNKDNTVKVIAEDYVASFPFGNTSSYQTSNVRNWLEKTEMDYSGVYYRTLSNPSQYLEKTEYQEDILKGNEVVSADQSFQDFISTLTIKDYIMANGKSSFLNNGKMFFLLGLSEDKENIYVEEDGSIQSCDSLSGFGIRPVITFKKNSIVTGGDGTKGNPYVISQSDNSYIDTYVRLGEDTWRVFEDQNDKLKLYTYGYLKMQGQEVFRNYSTTNSIFNLEDKDNIAYFLNTTYLNSLTFVGYLVDNDYYVGEISDDVGYSFTNIYSSKVTCKVGLLNIFDYNSNNYFDDYFHLNLTSNVGSMQYNIYMNGLLEEADVREEKHIAPVVSILKSSIKGGTGTVEDPYVVE